MVIFADDPKPENAEPTKDSAPKGKKSKKDGDA